VDKRENTYDDLHLGVASPHRPDQSGECLDDIRHRLVLLHDIVRA
jgi:hypothetical protein